MGTRSHVLTVISLGAGVQSSTMALMAAHGEIEPMPHGAIFADTKWEPAAVYRHLDSLEKRLPFPVYRVSAGSIVEGIEARRNTTGGRYPSIPWYVRNPDGSSGMGRRQCTSEYKLTPIMRKIRELLGVDMDAKIAPETVEQWVGISLDEAIRVKPARQRYITSRWPLIEQKMTRRDCLAWMERHGYQRPPKSACIGCPYHSQETWRRMRDEAPEEFANACRVDALLRQGDSSRGFLGEEYMHRAMLPLAEAVALDDDQFEIELFAQECEGMCGV